MLSTTSSDTDEAARAVLLGNDRGGYTIPTSGLYPYQWNWDSIFAAIGFATFDTDRAWLEIENLFAAQWPNGMVPHIIFRTDDPDYFPGPAVWGTDEIGLPWPTSGISQPPVAATAVRRVHEASSDRKAADERLTALFPKLCAFHDWWHAARDPDRRGIMAVSHPWESGRDNLPDWDQPGEAIDTTGIGEYKRRDTSHVDPHMRPHKLDYDRYLALVQFGRERGWDSGRIAAESPFWVADVGVTAILLRAERDLLNLALHLGEQAVANRIIERIARMEVGFGRLWNERIGAFCSLDLRTWRLAQGATAATLLCFYAGAGTVTQRNATLALAERWAAKVAYMTPSYDPEHAYFDPLRYWRGPVWPTINFLIGTGLAEAGHDALAERIRMDTAHLIEKTGFSEYYSPLDGKPAGGHVFTWTAAVWLAWASPNAAPGKATE